MGHRELHYRILNAISRDFCGEHNFPTCLDAANRIRHVLRDPEVDLFAVKAAVSCEPLIAARLIRLANTVAYNPAGKVVGDLSLAIGRLGFELVRTLSLAVALEQMSKAAIPAEFAPYARQAWERSVETSAIAHALAGQSRCNAEEALLAALLSQIGVFYLLFRASEEGACRQDQALTLQLLRDWHSEIRETILLGLEIPAPIRQALATSDSMQLPTESPFIPANLPSVLSVAARLDTTACAWDEDDAESTQRRTEERRQFGELIGEAGDAIREIRQALAG